MSETTLVTKVTSKVSGATVAINQQDTWDGKWYVLDGKRTKRSSIKVVHGPANKEEALGYAAKYIADCDEEFKRKQLIKEQGHNFIFEQSELLGGGCFLVDVHGFIKSYGNVKAHYNAYAKAIGLGFNVEMVNRGAHIRTLKLI